MDGSGTYGQKPLVVRNVLLRRKFQWVLFLAGAIALAILLTLYLCNTEPTYQGKPASYWFDQAEQTTDGLKEADVAFQIMGAKAVPFLLRILNQKPSALATKLDQVRDNYNRSHLKGIPPALDKAIPSTFQTQCRRATAAFLIKEIGRPAAAAIPSLMRISNSTNEDYRVVQEAYPALCAMGDELTSLVPKFIGNLKSPDEDVRETGVGLLRSTGPTAKAAVPIILKLLEDGKVRPLSAARALWSIDHQTNIALRVFTEGLQATNHGTKELSIYYLRQMGAAAKPAAAYLLPLLHDPDYSVRREAEVGLMEIAPELLRAHAQKLNGQNDSLIQKLVAMLETGDFNERTRAVQVVTVLGPSAKAAVPALIENLKGFPTTNSGPLAPFAALESQREIGEALAEIGPEARAAVLSLTTLGGDRRYPVTIFFKALGRIGPEAKDAVPLLQDALTAEDPEFRLAAADALTRIVPGRCSDAVAVLKSLQHDPELATVWVGNSSGMVSRSTRKDFENPASRFYRVSASVPLWRLGLKTQSPVAPLLKELEERSGSYERSFIDLVGDLGPEAKAALPKLKEYLAPPKWIGLRRAAAIAIRKIDPAEAANLGLPGLLAVP